MHNCRALCNAVYRELLEKVCRIANVLKSKGVKKGDTVAIYMPACPLAVASMLACARIGVVHRYEGIGLQCTLYKNLNLLHAENL